MKKAATSKAKGKKPHPILSLKNIDPKDPGLKPILESLQGNILRGHGRDHTVHIFFQFTGVKDDNRRILKLLSSRVTSAEEQEKQRNEYKLGKTDQTFRNLFLTAKGFASLGFTSTELSNAFPEPVGPVPINPQVKFINGMAVHRAELSDPELSSWEPGYANASGVGASQQRIDGMVLLANDDLKKLKSDETAVRAVLSSAANIEVTEYGKAIFNAAGTQNLEHFGYVDGRSQPTFFKDQTESETKRDGIDVWDPSEPLDLVLVPDRLVHSSDANNAFGSYFVFRKLEQNVRGFKAKEQELAEALSLVGDDAELAGAMAVGRFEDGTPVVQQPHDGLVDPIPNNFRFSKTDLNGSRCPFHAHIRKMSPRGDSTTSGSVPASTDAVERSHRIARRGITYGVRTVEPRDEPSLDQLPTRGVGLLFMCFQSNIDNQFGFMQRAWANNPQFARPLFGDASAGDTGLDPVIGQPTGVTPSPQIWPSPWGSTQTQEFGFESFVTMLGGDFFFAPSLAFFKNL